MSEVILYSGGMDSVIVSHLHPDAKKVYFDMKSRYSEAEMATLEDDVIIDETFDFSKLERDDAIIPYRNMYLVTRACDYGDVIYVGATEGDRSNDKDKRFFELASYVINHMNASWWGDGHEKRFEYPLKDLTKSECVQTYLNAGGDPQRLIDSFSCYTPVENKQCGNCKPCVRKFGALLLNHIDATSSFYVDPRTTEYWASELASDKRGRESEQLKELQ